MSQRVLNIIAKGKDEASGPLGNVGSAISGLGIAAAGAGLAVVGGAAAVGAAVADMTMEASSVENTATTFANLTAEIGGQQMALESLGEATRGMVSDADLMAAANKFLGMGLADTIEEASSMAEMATQLGVAMGEDATTSMENFALMMANQSIPRLDSFSMSSSEARTRIEELMEETAGLTREEAFNIAVMEQGKAAMERLGEQGDTSAAAVARWEAGWSNMRLEIGQQFIPVLESLFSDTFQPLLENYGPRIVEWAGIAAEWLGDFLPQAIDTLQGVWDIMKGGFETVSNIWSTALGPALGQLAEALGLDSEKIGEAVGQFDGFQAILTIAKIGVDGVVAGVQLLTIGVHAAKQAVEWFKDMLSKADQMVNNIRYAFERFNGWIERVRNSLNSLSIPEWLKGHSPSPLETSLLGINQALKDMPEMSFSLPASNPLVSGASTGGAVYHIQNNFGRDSVRSDADILSIADAIADALAIRGLQPAF